MNLTLRNAVAATALTFAFASPSFADLAPINTGSTGGLFTYNADFAVGTSADHQLSQGDFFTLYDITGLKPGTITTNSNFTYTTQNVGVTPTFVAPTDNASVLNITYTYNGATLNSDTTFTGFGFASTSAYSTQLGQFSSQDDKQLGNGSFNKEGNVGYVLLPSDVANPNALPTPEPGSVASFAFGACGLLGLAFMKRRNTSKLA